MSWRDDEQRARVCHALLRLVRWGELWRSYSDIDGPAGPTRQAIEWWREGSPLSSGEKVLFSLAWDVWNGEGSLSAHGLFELPPKITKAVGELLTAYAEGPEAVDRWIEGVDS